jgi:hypothetical protein
VGSAARKPKTSWAELKSSRSFDCAPDGAPLRMTPYLVRKHTSNPKKPQKNGQGIALAVFPTSPRKPC